MAAVGARKPVEADAGVVQALLVNGDYDRDKKQLYEPIADVNRGEPPMEYPSGVVRKRLTTNHSQELA